MLVLTVRHLAQSFNNLPTDFNLHLSTSTLQSKDNKHAQNEKPVLDFEAVRANRDRYRHWGTHFYDFCLLGGYRDQITRTESQKLTIIYIATKRHFELAVLRSVITPTEWNTFDDVIASKIAEDDSGKPWMWLEKIKEYYMEASSLIQDRYYF